VCNSDGFSSACNQIKSNPAKVVNKQFRCVGHSGKNRTKLIKQYVSAQRTNADLLARPAGVKHGTLATLRWVARRDRAVVSSRASAAVGCVHCQQRHVRHVCTSAWTRKRLGPEPSFCQRAQGCCVTCCLDCCCHCCLYLQLAHKQSSAAVTAA
jgi:hypothetical protein